MEIYRNITFKQDKDIVNTYRTLIDGAVQSHGIFQNEFAHLMDAHIKCVNSLLNKNETRDEGVQQLVSLVPQCPKEQLLLQRERWFNFCSQVVSSSLCGVRAKANACHVITTLLRDVSNSSELQKSVLSKQSGPFVLALASADSTWCFAALECLYEYLRLASGQALSYKVAIEKNLLKYLDSPLVPIGQVSPVSRAGQVYAALPLPGMGGGVQGRSEARGRQLTQLLSLAHSLMDYLFEGFMEKESYVHPREYSLPVTSVTSSCNATTDPVDTHLMAVTQLVNVMQFVSELVTSPINDAITIVPHQLLGIVFRILQVEISVLKKYHSQEHKVLNFLMPSLHQHSLLLLRDILSSIGDGVDAYFGVIAEALTSVIKSSVTTSCRMWCTDGQQTRIIAYSVMVTLVQISRGRHSPSPKLVNMILQDIQPKSEHVTLQKQQGKGLASLTVQKKKSKNKGYSVTDKNQDSQLEPMPHPEFFARVARVALVLVETLYSSASHSLLQKSKQSLQSSIISIASAITGGATLPDIYCDERTRAQLFRTLGSVANYPDPVYPPPYTIIIHILQLGLHDPQREVVVACQSALGSVSFILANPQISNIATSHQQQLQFNGNLAEDMEEIEPQDEDSNEVTHMEELEENGEDEDIEDMTMEDEINDEDKEEEHEESDEISNEEKDISDEKISSPVSEIEESIGDEEEEEIDTEEKESEKKDEKTDGKSNGIKSPVIPTPEGKSNGIKSPVIPTPEVKSPLKRSADEDGSDPKKVSLKRSADEDGSDPKKVSLKRAADEDGSDPKKVKEDSENLGPSIEEMLATFVDADPDIY